MGAVTNSRITGVYESGSTLLKRNVLPLLKGSTFTGGADGAIEFDVAFPVVFPHCYIFFEENTLWVTMDEEDPPNIIDGNPAAFHYCQMTSTTEGVVWDNTCNPATRLRAAIPASPTAFENPIVGGAGVIGAVVFDKTAQAAGLLSAGSILRPVGWAFGTPTASYALLSGEDTIIALSADNTTGLWLDLNLCIHTESSSLARLLTLVGALGVEADLTAAQDLTFEVTFTDPDEVFALTNFGWEADAR